MPYFAYFQIGATATSLAIIGGDRTHHVSGLAVLTASVAGGIATIVALRFLLER